MGKRRFFVQARCTVATLLIERRQPALSVSGTKNSYLVSSPLDGLSSTVVFFTSSVSYFLEDN